MEGLAAVAANPSISVWKHRRGCPRLATHWPDSTLPGLHMWLSFPRIEQNGVANLSDSSARVSWVEISLETPGFFFFFFLGQGSLLSFLRLHSHRLYRLGQAGRSPLIPHNLTLRWNSQGDRRESPSVPVPCSRDFSPISSLPAHLKTENQRAKPKIPLLRLGKGLSQ